MNDRLGTLLKEAADEALGEARLQPPTEAPVARKPKRVAWLAVAAAAAALTIGLGVWSSSGDGARDIDVVTPPDPTTLSPTADDPKLALTAAVARTMAESWEATLHVGGGLPDDVAYQPPDRIETAFSTGEVWISIGDRHWESRNGEFLEFEDGSVDPLAVLLDALGHPRSAEWADGIDSALFAEVDAAACAGDRIAVSVSGETCEIKVQLQSGFVSVVWIDSLRFSGEPNPFVQEPVQLMFVLPPSAPIDIHSPTTTTTSAPWNYETSPANWPGLGGPLTIAQYGAGTPIGDIGGLPEALDFLGVDYDLDTPAPSIDIQSTMLLESDGYLAIRLQPVGSGFEIRDVNYLRDGMDHSEPAEWQGGRSYSASEDALDLGGCETPRADIAVRYGEVEVREVWTDEPCPAIIEIERPMDQAGWIIERYGPAGDFTSVQAYQLPPGDGGAG